MPSEIFASDVHRRLTGTQQRVVNSVWRRLAQVAQASFDPLPLITERNPLASVGRAESEQQIEHHRLANHIFVVDGERGTGKTTIVQALHARAQADPSVPGLVGEEAMDRLLVVQHPKTEERWRVAHALPTVYPDMFTLDDSELPDILFDQIRHDLLFCAGEIEMRMHGGAVAGRGYGEPQFAPAGRSAESRDRARVLLDRLRDEIDTAWTYARNIGREVLSRDSIHYQEFVVNKGRFSSMATRRHSLLNEFLNAYLDYRNARLLFVTLDDCDLSPRHAEQVMNDIRIYLLNPRIVVAMALNVGATKHALRSAHLKGFMPVINALHITSAGERPEAISSTPESGRVPGEGEPDPYNLTVRRRRILDVLYGDLEFEWRELEQRIAKLLPPPQRTYIPYNAGDDVIDIVLPKLAAIEAESGTLATTDPIGIVDRILQDEAKTLEDDEAIGIYLWRTRYRDLFCKLTMRDLVYLRSCISQSLAERKPRIGNFAQHIWRTASLEEVRVDNELMTLADIANARFVIGEWTIADRRRRMTYQSRAAWPTELSVALPKVERSASHPLAFVLDVLRTLGPISLVGQADVVGTALSDPWRLVSRLTTPVDQQEIPLFELVLPINLITVADARIVFPLLRDHAAEQLAAYERAGLPEHHEGANARLPARASDAADDVQQLIREEVRNVLDRMVAGEPRSLRQIYVDFIRPSVGTEFRALVEVVVFGCVIDDILASGAWSEAVPDEATLNRVEKAAMAGLMFGPAQGRSPPARAVINPPSHGVVRRVRERLDIAELVGELSVARFRMAVIVHHAEAVQLGDDNRIVLAPSARAHVETYLQSGAPTPPETTLHFAHAALFGHKDAPDRGLMRRLDGRDVVLTCAALLEALQWFDPVDARRKLARDIGDALAKTPLPHGTGPIFDYEAGRPLQLAPLVPELQKAARRIANESLQAIPSDNPTYRALVTWGRLSPAQAIAILPPPTKPPRTRMSSSSRSSSRKRAG